MEGYAEFRRWYVGDQTQGSGPGSTPDFTDKWREFLAQAVKLSEAKTVLDWGCGDWQHSKLVDWNGSRYVGVEIVPELVEKLNREHGKESVSFLWFDPEADVPGVFLQKNCPRADLVVCKDVIQHLPNAEAAEIVATLVATGADVLLVNDLGSDVDNNIETVVGGCRMIDPRKEPFSLPAEIVFDFGSNKKAFLIPAGDSRLSQLPRI